MKNRGPCLSALDSERFGVAIARVDDVSLDGLGPALDFCRANAVRLLIGSCGMSDRRTLQAMEEAGFRLMDSMVVYERNLRKNPLTLDPPPDTVVIRPAGRDEIDAVATIAEQSFADYTNHYLADERLERAHCLEIYPDWVRRFRREGDASTEIHVALEGQRITGLTLLRMNEGDQSEVAMLGVLPESRRSAAAGLLLHHSMVWAAGQAAATIIGVMQATNAAVLRATIAVGWLPRSGFHIFHKWFPE